MAAKTLPRRSTAAPMPAYLAARVASVRAALAAAKAPALLITAYTDVSWLTGFEGDDSYVLLTPDKLILISDSRYAEQIQREVTTGGGKPAVTTILRKKHILEEVAKQIRRLKLQKIAVQSESMTLKGRASLLDFYKKSKRRSRTPLKLKPLNDLLVKPRHIKDPHEIAIIEEAIHVAEGAFLTVKKSLRPGMTENEIAGLIGFEMRQRGALNSSFNTIVAAGPNGSLPHYRPANVPLQNNSALLVDWGARYRGYVSDLTRVLFLGNPPPKIREIYQIVLDAQLTAIAAIKPGMHGKKIDKLARDVITKAGYGKQFGHGTGHGIGRDIHEAISLSKLSTTTLEPGMIVTVEPGIYLPGIGGVRIEDDILVTPTGCRVLSSLPKDLASASI